MKRLLVLFLLTVTPVAATAPSNGLYYRPMDFPWSWSVHRQAQAAQEANADLMRRTHGRFGDPSRFNPPVVIVQPAPVQVIQSSPVNVNQIVTMALPSVGYGRVYQVPTGNGTLLVMVRDNQLFRLVPDQGSFVWVPLSISDSSAVLSIASSALNLDPK